jgi:HK97 gp10 family phage protein
MSVEFDGIEDIIEKFEKLADKNILESNMKKACALVEGAARENTPKDSGDLRRSIESKVESSNTEVKGIVFSPLEYAPYVEFGTGLFAEKGGRKDVPWFYKDDKSGEIIATKGQHPQPYLRPALHNNREKITEILKRGLTE